jgi:hypothetical protein
MDYGPWQIIFNYMILQYIELCYFYLNKEQCILWSMVAMFCNYVDKLDNRP